MKLKKHRGRQHCDEATDDTDEIKTDPEVNTQPLLNNMMDVTTKFKSKVN